MGEILIQILQDYSQALCTAGVAAVIRIIERRRMKKKQDKNQ